jgi:cytoskeletal protein CcmA (bactofilin family)
MISKNISVILILLWAFTISTAYAGTSYNLPADATASPFNCTGSGSSYSCSSNISLGKEVTITLTADVTLNIAGNFDAGKELVIIANGYTLNLVATGNVSLEKDTEFTGNISADGNVDIAKDTTLVGDISAGGSVKIDKNFTSSGNITANGDIDIDKDSSVVGNLTAGGSLDLAKNTVVSGVCSPVHPQCSGTASSCGSISIS